MGAGLAGRRKAPARCRRGASSVEFAIVGSIFFLFVLGIFEISRAFTVVHLLTDASRHGCRLAVLPGKTSAQVTSAVASVLALEGLAGYTTTIRVNGTAAEVGAAQSGDDIEVEVSVPVCSITWMPCPRWLEGDLSGRWYLVRE